MCSPLAAAVFIGVPDPHVMYFAGDKTAEGREDIWAKWCVQLCMPQSLV
jgi:hypothetical protein